MGENIFALTETMIVAGIGGYIFKAHSSSILMIGMSFVLGILLTY
ncbi:hypothetical protein [Oceanobacillus piezotolerans]|nr:hypothetical protein [Oceanobacillus piezotolerans]